MDKTTHQPGADLYEADKARERAEEISGSRINVEVYRASLKTGTSWSALTLKLAKQFPVYGNYPGERRVAFQHGESTPAAICKINGATLGHAHHAWLILIPHQIAGLAWTVPVEGLDDLVDIPTVVL